MKKYTLTLLLTAAAPLFAGTPAPVAPAPLQNNTEQGFTLGLEAMALQPFQSGGGYRESQYDFGWRASLGYQFADGLFVKATYFAYNTDTLNQSWLGTDATNQWYDQTGNSMQSLPQSFSDTQYTTPTPTVNSLLRDKGSLDMSYLDLVIGQNFKPSDKFTLSPYVGLRWAEFKESYSSQYAYDSVYTPVAGIKMPADTHIVGSQGAKSDFSGLGIVVGIDATRTLAPNFSVYATLKEAVVFGTSDNNFSDYQATNGVTDWYSTPKATSDRVVSITEVGIGLQYDFCFANVAANIRAGVEGQWWGGLSTNINHAGNFGQDSENTGLAGFVLGANFRF